MLLKDPKPVLKMKGMKIPNASFIAFSASKPNEKRFAKVNIVTKSVPVKPATGPQYHANNRKVLILILQFHRPQAGKIL